MGSRRCGYRVSAGWGRMERDHLEAIGVEEKIILRRTFKMLGEVLCIGLLWFRVVQEANA
jgi:hypothetical protein